MENVISGNNAIIELSVGGSYVPFVCVKSFSVNTTSELIEITTLNTGKFKDYELQSLDYSISLNTILIIASPNASGKFLYDQQQLGNKVAYRITFTDRAGEVFQISGITIVESTLLGISSGQMVTGDFNLRGCGSFATTGGTVPVIGDQIFTGMYQAVGGELFITDANLIGASIIEVMRNGIGLIVIFIGIPNGSQVNFDSTTGTLTFTLALAAGEYIQYIYSK